VKLRPRVEVFCFKDDKVLCHRLAGYVTFPGGGIDPFESAIMAARRETFEETDRALINARVAHPPTAQVWPDDTKGKPWAKGFDGGYTYWITGSVGDAPRRQPGERHADYEEFEWLPIGAVLGWLGEDKAKPTAWSDDIDVRRDILQTHMDLRRTHGPAPSKRASFGEALGSV
jgi:8-oxo-dGTP pyrophosphatase MutT (NUDIX family)